MSFSLQRSWAAWWRSSVWCPTKEPSWPAPTASCGRTGALLLVCPILMSTQMTVKAAVTVVVLVSTDLELYNDALKVIQDFPQFYPFKVTASGWREKIWPFLFVLFITKVVIFANKFEKLSGRCCSWEMGSSWKTLVGGGNWSQSASWCNPGFMVCTERTIFIQQISASTNADFSHRDTLTKLNYYFQCGYFTDPLSQYKRVCLNK